MSGKRNMLVTFGFVLSVSLIAAAVTAWLVSYHCSRLQFELLSEVCGEVAEQEPEARRIVAAAIKDYTDGNSNGVAQDDMLSALGYHPSDFSGLTDRQSVLFMLAGFLAGISLFILTFSYRNRMEAKRIRALAAYLEQVNTGKAIVLSASGEDDFARLEDEIYKTVTSLCQTKELAVRTKNGFAENLSNIAHQMKTPITAMSLSVQMMEKRFESGHLEQIGKQLSRLSHLEEALLLLSRIDAGTLALKMEKVDVFTLLVLAADTLQELLSGTGTGVDIPELGEMTILADERG